MKGNSIQHLSDYLKGNNNSVYDTRSMSQITLNSFKMRLEKLENSFFRFTFLSGTNYVIQQSSKNIKKFKITSIKDIKCNEQSFSIHDSQDVKLFSRLRLNSSHLNEHKLSHNFKGCVTPMSGCRL